jgi:D-alanine--poly(phosphoribitol) ligase subunit 2
MNFEEITTIINDYVIDHFEIKDDPDYSPDVHLFDYGYVDSLGATEIVMFIEQRFGCVISQKDISKYPMNTVKEIAQVVEEKLR